MKNITMAQVERAIGYWRKHYVQARPNPADELEEQLLTELYRRMLEQHLGAIGADQLSSSEIGALRCLNDMIGTSREDQ